MISEAHDPKTNFPAILANARETWAREGYLFLPDAMPKDLLANLRSEIVGAFAEASKDFAKNRIGGTLHGHLNCFPGEQTKAFADKVESLGIKQIMEEAVGESLTLISAGCNINMPGSHAQNFHIDGEFNDPWIVVNATLVDTDVRNGATEIVPGTHASQLLYWEFMLKGFWRKRVRRDSVVGDIVIRPTTLWHRGMPNRSDSIRPMIGLVYAPSRKHLKAEDFTQYGGKVTFIPNRYDSSLKGRVGEAIATYLPQAAIGMRIFRSFFLKKAA